MQPSTRRVLLVLGVLLVVASHAAQAATGPSRGSKARTEAAQRRQQVTEDKQESKQASDKPQKQQQEDKQGSQQRSNGKILNSVAEFEIVNENNPKGTGDLQYAAPTFSASIVANVFAVSGVDNVTENLQVDGPFGIWSVDAEQRFFWAPVDNGKPRVSIEGRADAPKKITIRGRWGGPSDSVASIGRIGTRGVVPRELPVSFAAPATCSYTWTDPVSFCHVIYTGKLTSSPSFGLDTTMGAFLEGSLRQDAWEWMKYAEVTCDLDLDGKGAPYERDCSNAARSRAISRIKLAPITVTPIRKP